MEEVNHWYHRQKKNEKDNMVPIYEIDRWGELYQKVKKNQFSEEDKIEVNFHEGALPIEL